MSATTRRSLHLLRHARLSVLTIAVVSACSSSVPASTQPTSGSSSDAACPATPQEEQFGCGAATNGSITYQPDVVIVGGGGNSIRSWESDGVSWIIDGHAPGADRIAPGKIVFVTERAVGRVLRVAPVANDLRITLGPVGLGEVIQDGELRWDEPISLDDMIPTLAKDMPGISTQGSMSDPEPSAQAMGGFASPPSPAALPAGELVSTRSGSGQTLANGADAPKVDVFIGPNWYGAVCCTPQAGAYFKIFAPGIHGKGAIWLRIEQPFITGYARVKHGEVTESQILIAGVKGIHLEFEVASDAGPPPTNINELAMLPVQWAARPKAPRGEAQLLNSYTEAFQTRTAFSSGSSTLVGSADYDFDQDVLQAKFDSDELVDVLLPRTFKTKTSMLDTMTGVSLGVTGVVFSMLAQFCLCHGPLWYSNGVFIQLRSAFGISNDASTVAVLGGRCRSVVFEMEAVVGAGHSMLGAFVSAFNTEEKLDGDNAIEATDGIVEHIPLWNEVASIPAGIRRCT